MNITINKTSINRLVEYNKFYKFVFTTESDNLTVTDSRNGSTKVYEGLSVMTTDEIDVLVDKVIGELE